MRVEALGGGVEVCVNRVHTFGSDAFLLSAFAAPRRRDTVCDLGCGCGIVALLWFRSGAQAPQRAWGLELQPQAAALAALSAERSGLAERLTILEGDLKNLPDALPRAGFDLVACNPPYKTVGAGVMSASSADQIARHETACTLNDVAAAAAKLLRFGGRLCLCQLPERLPDVFEAMRLHRIEPKRMRLVQERADTPPWLVLVEGVLGAKPFLRVEKPLLMRENGEDSPELQAIYSGYRKEGTL